MRRIYLPILCIILFIACETQEDKIIGKVDGKIINVSGKVKDVQNGQKIYLYEFDVNTRNMLDSISVSSDGTFSFKVGIESPRILGLNVYNQHVPFLASDSDVKLTIDGNAEDGSYEVEGSADNQYYKEYMELRQKAAEKMEEIQLALQADPTPDGFARMQQEHQTFSIEFTNDVKSLIKKTGDSYVTMYLAAQLDPEEHPEYMEDIASRLEKAFPQSEDAKQFKKEVFKATSLTVGRMAPDFSLPKLSGDAEITLSQLRGKYVLIDFWASWCAPCRAENPNVKKMYAKYQDKGFEILGVSTDVNLEAWEKAIDDDGLPWLHVSDKSGEVASMYNVVGIPFTVLLDPEGKIIGKNLRGESLESALEDFLM